MSKQTPKSTFTLTFSECVENHAGMQMIGDSSNKQGFSVETLQKLAKKYNGKLYDLNSLLDDDPPELSVMPDDASLLVFKNGLENIFGISQSDLFDEHKVLDVDKKAFMYGRTVNKKARHNLCFADFSQEPDYENKKGRVINFKDDSIKLTNLLRQKLSEFGDEFKDLYAEGNYYYDVEKTFIGAHGDTERKCVVGVRLGETFPLHYQWYYKGSKVGNFFSTNLNGGDIYIMSAKAVGTDWKSRNRYTLRHAAGFLKNIKEFENESSDIKFE